MPDLSGERSLPEATRQVTLRLVLEAGGGTEDTHFRWFSISRSRPRYGIPDRMPAAFELRLSSFGPRGKPGVCRGQRWATSAVLELPSGKAAVLVAARCSAHR